MSIGKLTYIGFNGSQYVDGITLPQNYKIVLDAVLYTTRTYYNLFDSDGPNGNPMLWVSGAGMLEFDCDYSTRYNVAKNQRLTIQAESAGESVLYVNGVKITTMPACAGSYKIHLFNRGGGQCFKGKLYGLTVYDGETPVYDFVPALDEEGEAGLYEQIGGVFYANRGTGAFEQGEPVMEDATKYLLRSGTTLYTVRDGALAALAQTTPTAALFVQDGLDELPPSDWLKMLANPAVLKWTNAAEIAPMAATVAGVPYPQTLETVVDMTSESITGISSMSANYSGDVGVRYSVDEKATFGAEVTVAEFLNTDKAALFAAAQGTRRLWLRFTLHAGAQLTDFQIKFKN